MSLGNSVAAILLLLFMVRISIISVLNLLLLLLLLLLYTSVIQKLKIQKTGRRREKPLCRWQHCRV